MKKTTLYALWGCLFLLCGLLGLWEEPEGVTRVALTVISLLFFCPPAVLLLQARRQQDWKTFAVIRSLSAASLLLSAVLITVNFLSALGSDTLGIVLNVVLSLVSAPMLCSGFWILSLFGWACLLVVSHSVLRSHKKSWGSTSQ